MLQICTDLVEKKVWNSVNRDNVISSAGKFLNNLWPHLKPYNKTQINTWIVSRRHRVHQKNCNVFLILQYPHVLRFVRNTKFRELLDLMVNLVVDYQHIMLVKRQNKPGKRNIWADENMYSQ